MVFYVKIMFCWIDSMDATKEPASTASIPKLGRLVNHGNLPKERNSRMKILDGPVLALFATSTINPDEQILYDYGVKVPWITRFVYE